MQFYQRPCGAPVRLGVLAGSFNPPTIAHRALASAATLHVDQVLWVVPGILPHKPFFGATLEERLDMLAQIEAAATAAIATTENGLFVDIARECRAEYGADTRLSFLCGRDAAERILTWDYGRPGVVEEMLGEFDLLVAPRSGGFQTPQGFQNRIRALEIGDSQDHVSSTEVRERMARGEAWEHLVPAEIVERVRSIYS